MSIIKILAAVLTLVFCSSVLAAPAHIIILRHGEKVSDEERTLSPRGYARAEALADYFSDSRFLSVYGKPAVFYAASAGKKSSLRSIETITPAAQKLGMIVDDSFKKDDGEELMLAVLANKELDGRTVVICWNHSGISDLLKPLDGDFPNKWGNQIFDRFWILDHQSDGTYSFKSIPQDLLPGDANFLKLATQY